MTAPLHYCIVEIATSRLVYEGCSLTEASEALERGTCFGRSVSRVGARREAREAACRLRNGMVEQRAQGERTCLRCGCRFNSNGPGNRICTPCRALDKEVALRPPRLRGDVE